MTQRVAFVLRVKASKVDEYVEAHAHVWPGMLAALRAAGFRNYSIFRYGTLMFGYYEAVDSEQAAQFMAASPINAKWQDAMADLLESRVPDQGPSTLLEVFRLD